MKKHRIFALCMAGILQTGFIGMYATSNEVLSVTQQLITVKGTVVDANEEPLIGVNVSVKGTSTGAITDIEGQFTLSVKAGDVLVFSYIGYQKQEVTAQAGRPLKVILREDSETLDEVVVIGYGTSRKKDITGAIASVKAEELNTVSSSSVSQMLQGKVTGMSAIQTSAQPGAGIAINIRGSVSPNGSNAPLYVIDGVPLQNNSTADPGISGIDYKTGVDRDPLNSINPSDIESIEVLKDASAAAIYGASAANGVVLITTKSGNAKMLAAAGIDAPNCEVVGTILHVLVDGTYAGHIVIADTIKVDAEQTIHDLHAAGVKRTVMLTGDREEVAASVAKQLGLDEFHAQLLPGDKVERVEALLAAESGKGKLAFVGDGINDAPVLTRADVGIAMGAMGSDAAIEAADVVLMDDKPSDISRAIRVARKTMSIVWQNIIFALGIKLLILVLAALGIANMWLAVFGDVGVAIIAILNAMRAMGVKNL